MRRAIFLILIIVLAFYIPHANAEEKTVDKSKSLLVSLGIISDDIDQNKNVTRIEFAKILSTLIFKQSNDTASSTDTYFVDIPYADKNASAVAIVAEIGAMNGVGGARFEPLSEMTQAQCIKALVVTLGYGMQAEAKGGYPYGYVSMATQIGLLKNINVNLNETLTYGVLLNFIRNALEIDIVIQTVFGQQPEYKIQKGKTLLTEKLKVESVEGVLKGTWDSSINEVSLCQKYYVNIGGQLYNCGGDAFDLNKLIGYHIKAYFTKTDTIDDQKLLWFEAGEGKNSALSIDADWFVDYDGGKISYMNSSNDKLLYAAIDPSFDLILNGKPVDVYDKSIFKFIDGTITMIDNDGDSVYNLVTIEKINTTVVKAVNSRENMLIDLYSANNTVDLKNIDDDNIKIYNEKEKRLSFKDIKEGDVVTWTVSQDHSFYKLIVFQENSVLGTVEEIQSGDEYMVTIDGIEYEVAPPYTQQFKKEVFLGTNGNFYTDFRGRVVGFRAVKSANSGWKYGYLIDADEGKGIQSVMNFRILASDGKVFYPKATDNIKVDDEVCQTNQAIRTALGSNIRQVIRYTQDASGNIKKIDTIADNKEGNSLIRKYNKSDIAYKGMGVGSFSGLVAIDSSSVVFIVPEDDGDDEDYYATNMDYFETDTSYTIEAYGMAKTVISDVILLERANSENLNQAKTILVDSIVKTLDNKGEQVYKLQGYYMGNAITYYAYLTIDFSQINQGDIIKCGEDSKGYVSEIDIVFQKNGVKKGLADIAVNTTANPRMVFGKVALKEGSQIMIVADGVQDIENSKKEIHNTSAFGGKIFLYDSSKRQGSRLSIASVEDIYDYEGLGDKCSRVLIETATFWPRTIVIYN